MSSSERTIFTDYTPEQRRKLLTVIDELPDTMLKTWLCVESEDDIAATVQAEMKKRLCANPHIEPISPVGSSGSGSSAAPSAA